MRKLSVSASAVLLVVLARPLLYAQAPAARSIYPVRQWTGMVADKSLANAKPAQELVTDQSELDRVWKAWGRSDAAPRVDFSKEFVLVITSDLEVLKVYLEGDEKGNFKRWVQIEKIEARGFAYGIAVFLRAGIRTINGVAVSGPTVAVEGSREPTYPDTEDGLRRMMSDIYAATQDGDRKKARQLIEALVLPNHEAWFKDVFGDVKGARVAAEYGQLSERFAAEVERLFAEVVREGQSGIHIRRFDKAPDSRAVGNQNDALAAMTRPRPLYSVRFIKPGERLGQHVYSFVYAEGGFRLVGKMRAALK